MGVAKKLLMSFRDMTKLHCLVLILTFYLVRKSQSIPYFTKRNPRFLDSSHNFDWIERDDNRGKALFDRMGIAKRQMNQSKNKYMTDLVYSKRLPSEGGSSHGG